MSLVNYGLETGLFVICKICGNLFCEEIQNERESREHGITFVQTLGKTNIVLKLFPLSWL